MTASDHSNAPREYRHEAEGGDAPAVAATPSHPPDLDRSARAVFWIVAIVIGCVIGAAALLIDYYVGKLLD